MQENKTTTDAALAVIRRAAKEKYGGECPVTLNTDTDLVSELGFSSVEITVLLADMEDSFGIRIPAAALRRLRTAGDLCTLTLELTEHKQQRGTRGTRGKGSDKTV